jgi:hypothetical protein
MSRVKKLLLKNGICKPLFLHKPQKISVCRETWCAHIARWDLSVEFLFNFFYILIYFSLWKVSLCLQKQIFLSASAYLKKNRSNSPFIFVFQIAHLFGFTIRNTMIENTRFAGCQRAANNVFSAIHKIHNQ